MDGYEQLANAIILKAVDDYRSTRIILAREPNNVMAQREVIGCEKFFLSSWFQTLTSIDGASLLEKLRKEIRYG
jgi:hypothetical protein